MIQAKQISNTSRRLLYSPLLTLLPPGTCLLADARHGLEGLYYSYREKIPSLKNTAVSATRLNLHSTWSARQQRMYSIVYCDQHLGRVTTGSRRVVYTVRICSHPDNHDTISRIPYRASISRLFKSVRHLLLCPLHDVVKVSSHQHINDMGRCGFVGIRHA